MKKRNIYTNLLILQFYNILIFLNFDTIYFLIILYAS